MRLADMRHPDENELALLAGGECGRVARFLLNRHVRDCRECTAKVARFEILRADLARMAPPELDWDRLAAEMKANIRLGLEAGECVRAPHLSSGGLRRQWNPRLAVAFASLTFLIAAGLTMKSHVVPAAPVATQKIESSPVLESSGAGVQFRDGESSITLTNRSGAIADQTVNAQGEIGARYVEHGAVTITNVSLN
jgi:anti-sigma factor RsiW